MTTQQVFWAPRQFLWVIGVGLGGFYIGGMGGGELGGFLGFIWGACIGFGFGSIVSEKHATKLIVVYWGLTLALMGTFLGLLFGAPDEPSVAQLTVAGAIGTAIGMLFGSFLGVIHLWRLRATSQTSHSDSVS